jgi:hypothetical protein
VEEELEADGIRFATDKTGTSVRKNFHWSSLSSACPRSQEKSARMAR